MITLALMMVLRRTHGLFEPRDEEGVVAALAQLDLQVQQLRHLAVGDDTQDTSQQEGGSQRHVTRGGSSGGQRSSRGGRLRKVQLIDCLSFGTEGLRMYTQ